MAPGCSNIQVKNLFPDTVDSFEVLEQTVMKQKKLAKRKKSDLRLRILLKRTFDLVCEIMDRENGFEEDFALLNTTKSTNLNDSNLSKEPYSHCSSKKANQINIMNIIPSMIPLPPNPMQLQTIQTPPPPPPKSNPPPPPPPPPAVVEDLILEENEKQLKTNEMNNLDKPQHIIRSNIQSVNEKNESNENRKSKRKLDHSSSSENTSYNRRYNKKLKLIDMNSVVELKDTRLSIMCV